MSTTISPMNVVVVDFEGVEDTSHSASCEVCYYYKPSEDFVTFSNCGHKFCVACVKEAFESDIMESRVKIQCLRCPECVLQSEIRQVVDSKKYERYLSFTVRQFLMTQQPNVCFCLAPNCPYACINSSPDYLPGDEGGDYDRNHFMCRRDECQSEHCNKCKRAWHPDRTCEEFEREMVDLEREGITEEMRRSMDAKNCPTCDAIIQKSSDGCNQVICAICKTSFCWLCGKQVTEMHYMSPTGCSLYGRRRWSQRKRWCCRASLWLTAPLLAFILSIVVVPVVLIVFPLGIGYKVHKACDSCKCYKVCEVTSVALVVTVCVIVSPLVALLAALLLFPLTLLYIYCFIPCHVCLQS